jgi:hypothetical protein
MQNAVKTAKAKKEVALLVPEQNLRCRRWLILGLDPSMSRTGFALLDVRPALAHTPEEGPYTDAIWLAAGSLKPEIPKDAEMHSRNTLWQRSKAIATYVREMVKQVAPDTRQGKGDFHVCNVPECCKPEVGLIVSMEFPTPTNDFLVSLNRIINLILFEDGVLAERFAEIRIMLTNAATMRSLMKLTQRGNKNKAENVQRAYDFIDRARFPELDTDACDAVLMAMMARHAASIMLGNASELPENFLNSLCNATQEVKGKGRNAHTVTRGLLHRIEYWYKYERKGYTVCVKDASNPKKSLSRVNFSI